MKAFLTSSLFLLLALAFSLSGLAAANSKSHRTIDPDDAYKNNCMRCHTALPQYSPRMSKTIVMHMRVAANIPADEAAAILAYLNGSPQASTKAAPKPSTSHAK
jgi:hypothetical protein